MYRGDSNLNLYETLQTENSDVVDRFKADNKT